MAKRPEGYWKKYYEDHREQRKAESTAYAQEHPEARKAYLAQYYKDHPEKWEKNDTTREERREKARQRYASDPGYRAKRIADAKLTRLRNPDTRLKRALKHYGLTIDEYNILAQSGCAICGSVPRGGDRRTLHFHIDHCHVTGAFRGLLCSSCNLGLGKFRDSAVLLEKAAQYLRTCKGY